MSNSSMSSSRDTKPGGRGRLVGVMLLAILLAAAAGYGSARWQNGAASDKRASKHAARHEGTEESAPPRSNEIEFPKASWEAAGIEMRPVVLAPVAQSLTLTGKIALNEDRVAHIYPLVDGRVAAVHVQFGSQVEKGDLLVMVQSKEVGQAKLQLYQDRLEHEFAVTKDEWTQSTSSNAQSLLGLIRGGAPIEEIEKDLKNRPLGVYRDRLMTAYIAAYRSRKTLERLEPLSQGGTVSGRQLLDAEADWNAARATLQSVIEQIQAEAQQTALISRQTVRGLETRVAVDETRLRILGLGDDDLKNIEPSKQEETLSQFPLTAPLDGTIIAKDVVLMERVGPETQILSIADLSTVWVTADVYEGHLAEVSRLENQIIRLKTNAYPERTFEAKVFYTGDVVNEASRTVALRAVAKNEDHLLKPGMFVSVELPEMAGAAVPQVLREAVQEYEGKKFVFVHKDGDHFERRDVALGAENERAVEIREGVKAGDQVVTKGGFALKSRMLADLLEE